MIQRTLKPYCQTYRTFGLEVRLRDTFGCRIAYRRRRECHRPKSFPQAQCVSFLSALLPQMRASGSTSCSRHPPCPAPPAPPRAAPRPRGHPPYLHHPLHPVFTATLPSRRHHPRLVLTALAATKAATIFQRRTRAATQTRGISRQPYPRGRSLAATTTTRTAPRRNLCSRPPPIAPANHATRLRGHLPIIDHQPLRIAPHPILAAGFPVAATTTHAAPRRTRAALQTRGHPPQPPPPVPRPTSPSAAAPQPPHPPRRISLDAKDSEAFTRHAAPRGHSVSLPARWEI